MPSDNHRGRPREQQGYRLHSWDGCLAWDTFACPEPSEGEVLIEVDACGIGLTVLNYSAGNLDDDVALLPRVPGHELVGRVVDVGSAADDGLLGALVTAYFYLFCGQCRRCLAGQEPNCERLAGWVGVHRDGGYAPYTVLPSQNGIALPSSIDPVTATVVPDAVATPVHVCGTRAGLGPADRVVVIGAGGGVGAHMVQVARTYCRRVAGVDVTEEKLQTLEDLGIMAIDGSDLGSVDAAKLWRAGRPTAVIDLVGTDETLSWAFDSLDTRGRLVVVTTFRGRAVTAPTRRLVFGEVTITGSRYASRAEVVQAAALVAAGDVTPVIGTTTAPAGVPAVHEQLRNQTLLGRGALDWRAASQSPG